MHNTTEQRVTDVSQTIHKKANKGRKLYLNFENKEDEPSSYQDP